MQPPQGQPNAMPPPPGYPMTPLPGQLMMMGQPQPFSPALVVAAPGLTPFGPYPQQVTCPYCRARVITMTRCTPSTFAIILTIIGLFFWFCIFYLPLLICQDVEHQCPVCGGIVGIYRDPTCSR